ncbi:MAG: hypothetical protein QG551_414 [Patescibacteria group bacterium]|jgi:hypothetical protein|nr:hypothetical protein [Patescibacteria group bacterium]
MAYEQVVAILGERLGSFLELMKKLLITWELDPKKLLDYFHNEKQENLVGLLEGTHKVMAIRNGKAVQPVGTLTATVDLDCDVYSSNRLNLDVQRHDKGGKVTVDKYPDGSLYVDGRRFTLYQSKHQLEGKTVTGNELLRELDGKLFPNSTLLGFLQANQSFLPREMKSGRMVFFFGSVYGKGEPWVLCNGPTMFSEHRDLNKTWGPDDYVALLEN